MKRKSFLGIKRCRLDVPRYKWIVLQFVCLADAVVNICLLGFFVVHWRGNFLFSDWMDCDN